MKPYLIEIGFFSIFLVVTSLRGTLLVIRRRRLAQRLAGSGSDELVFHELGITAFSDNGLLCEFSSRQTLELVLTRSELWLRDACAPGSASEQRLCNIVLSSIRSIRPQGKFIKIDFLSKSGLSDTLLLRLNDRKGFVEQLNALVLPAPLPFVPLRLFKRSAEQEPMIDP